MRKKNCQLKIIMRFTMRKKGYESLEKIQVQNGKYGKNNHHVTGIIYNLKINVKLAI